MKKLWLVCLLLSATLFACPTMPYGDLNCDGQVDLADFAILADNWLKEYEMSYPNKVQVSGDIGTAGFDYTTPFNLTKDPSYVVWSGAAETTNGTDNLIINYESGRFQMESGSYGGIWALPDAPEEDGPVGEYTADEESGATGTATVAEYISLSLAAITASWDGASVTLTAGTVAGGIEPVSYQWAEYVDGVWGDIGADSDSVALTERDPDATYRFRLTVTDAADEAVTRYLTLNAKGLVGLISDGALIGDGGLIAEGPLIAAG